MESFLQDLRHSLRMFWQSRGGLWHRLQHRHQASDPLVFFLVPAVLALTALIAVWI